MHTAIPVTCAQFDEIATEALELKLYLNSAHSCFHARFYQRWHYFQIVESLETIGNNEIDEADDDFKDWEDDP